jgi:hypothetical protein
VLITLAFRHLLVHKVRALFLLLGFSLGVGVMIVLLSVGEAMLEQSRDVSLVGGGEVTVLPQGIDIEAMRTGGVSGMFFGIDRARFLSRLTLGGPRYRELLRVVSPAIEGKLLYLKHGDQIVPVRAGGEIPSRTRAVGSALNVTAGHWDDSPADSSYVLPTRQQLYDELDRFHIPPHPEPSWAEWHYFNLITAPDEWWYITYLVAGEVPDGRWGGELIVTHRRPDGQYDRFTDLAASPAVVFDTARADVAVGPSSVKQRNAVYHLSGSAGGRSGRVKIRVAVKPAPNFYFPPVELTEPPLISGYVVPGLSATASGEICVGSACSRFSDAPAYHDHNWGVWRDVTWEWGVARGRHLTLLYGGVYGPGRDSTTPGPVPTSPFFLTVVDSLGVKQVLRFDRINYHGKQAVLGLPGATAPTGFQLTSARGPDTLRLDVHVQDALATGMAGGGVPRTFLQMRGRFQLSARVGGEMLSDSGAGFFETYTQAPSTRPPR